MIADLQPYPAMKDSGVPWLGEVPEQWQAKRLAQIGRFSKGNGGTKEDEVTAGVPCVRYGDLYTTHTYFIRTSRSCVAPERAEDYTPIEYGDVLFAASGETIDEIGKSAVSLIRSEACCGGDVILFRPVVEVEARFMGYATDCRPAAAQKASMARGTTVKHIYGDQLKYLSIAIPPLPEQAAIVRFLDHADGRIRRYIRAKQKLIKLLEEQKQAIIHRAVTRGLDPNVRVKPSGVEWLGDVPEHWEAKRLKWVTRLQRGYDLPAELRMPGPFPVVSSGGLIDTHSASKSAGPGVVMGRYGSTDAVFYVEQDFWPHNTSLFVTHFQGNMPKWCYYLLRSITKAEHAGKSAVPGVDRKDLFQIVVAVPPVDEQLEIVRLIEARSQHQNDAIAAAQREISLFREYRTRLIADVVTGKFDVREAAARLPDEDDESEPRDETVAMTDTEEGIANDPDDDAEQAEA